MKKSLLILILLPFVTFTTKAQNIRLNELHYDNAGTDEGEFIEVVLENAGSYTLSDFAITLYNGNDGASYDTKTLDQFTSGTVDGNFTIFYYDYPSNGIQNGPEDGIAISYQGTLIDGQFLSYEGTLTATDGPANGETSTDIGVSEDSSTETGTSLQLSGTGTAYIDFTWEGSAPETEGDLNNNQEFGTYVPDPEPSEYPTNYSGTAEGMNINLTWTDSGGEQLPAGYLILGDEFITKNGNYTTPVDGVPVGDDLDWADGEISVNVPFGVEEVTIPVNSGYPYQFVIFPYTNAGVYIDYKTDGTPPETNVTSNNFVIINSDEFALDLGNWTQYSVVGDQMWVYDPNHGIPMGCAVMNGYSGGPVENEDWLISPIMNWEDFDSIYFGFYSATNYTGPALQLYVSQDYEEGGDPNNYTWQEITDQYTWSETGFTWTESGNADLTSYAGSSVSLAFKYTSTSAEASTWEVDNLIVFGTLGTDIGKNKVENIGIYPNPASKYITLNNASKGELSIVNLTGQTLKNLKIETKNAQVDVSDLATGLYIVRYLDGDNGLYTGKLFIK